MSLQEQSILPAIRKMKDLEKLMKSAYTYIVLLDSHIGQLKSIVDLGRANGKKLLLHADLIEGLKNDEFAAEFLCQTIRPAGIISTRGNVITKTRQNGLLAIQRLFLLDSSALEKSYALLERSQPDYIEVMPGVIPHIIREVKERSGIPIFAGGLIRSVEDVEQALSAGATAVTTSNHELWKHYEGTKKGPADQR
ncbi:glycerol-3-phosphate responsive antiterminator [Paenibacillus roseipurpureus]|uniref:Glycerol uptake operon antiterminator regulatory protein n=1 Tax=Paenibacillus roseopurpureus TaxID=2918901 RepID=A0AA96LRC3_9BACL|nr:glycerol-3-phosphate responsive antiterminator [Paenibacillus sp. MBLB1832]WNR44458.1 glycerol-3-phosphate responsive antiterminator [Paenibacillus sp. MBLB1832]